MSHKLLNIKNLYADLCEFQPMNVDYEEDFDPFYNHFLEYFNERIRKTKLYKIMFKHYFPNHKRRSSSLLSEHLYELIMDYLYEDVLSGNETD